MNTYQRDKFLIPNEPARFMRSDMDELLSYAAKCGASDITMQTNEFVFAEVFGKFYPLTRHKMSNTEVEEFSCKLYGSESARAIIKDQRDLDGAYEVKLSRSEKYRFRYNITACQSEGNDGIQLTCRTIPVMPPDIKTMKVADILIKNFAPKQGIICVTGATGSGKSTLLAGVIRNVAEDPEGHKKILTYESPIEFIYDDVIKPTTIISQSEIPKHLPDFAHAIRNALRRKPSIILIGEARDAETIGEAITASMTGHLVYTTVHSNGVADTIRRMVNAFPEGERNSRAVDLVSSLKMIVSQMLLPSTDGKRVALREYLIFDQDILEELMEAGVENLTQVTRKIVKLKGQTFYQDAKNKFEEGILGEDQFNIVKQMNKGVDKDVQEITKHNIEKITHQVKNIKKVDELDALDILDIPAPSKILPEELKNLMKEMNAEYQEKENISIQTIDKDKLLEQDKQEPLLNDVVLNDIESKNTKAENVEMKEKLNEISENPIPISTVEPANKVADDELDDIFAHISQKHKNDEILGLSSVKKKTKHKTEKNKTKIEEKHEETHEEDWEDFTEDEGKKK